MSTVKEICDKHTFYLEDFASIPEQAQPEDGDNAFYAVNEYKKTIDRYIAWLEIDIWCAMGNQLCDRVRKLGRILGWDDNRQSSEKAKLYSMFKNKRYMAGVRYCISLAHQIEKELKMPGNTVQMCLPSKRVRKVPVHYDVFLDQLDEVPLTSVRAAQLAAEQADRPPRLNIPQGHPQVQNPPVSRTKRFRDELPGDAEVPDGAFRPIATRPKPTGYVPESPPYDLGDIE